MLHMFERRPDLKSAHIFADHLEATLDLAEELELLHLIIPEPAADRDVLAGLDRIGAFVERIEVIELAIAAKLDLARAAARRIADRDARLSTFSKLFHAGTQPLVDLYPSLADPGGRIFDSGHDPLTFLQARGTIEESRCTLEDQRYLVTGEDYLLLGTVKLGAFIELCDTCLKAIDRQYHLYESDEPWEAGRASTLDLLRERRDEAIRAALGVTAPVIDAPVEIVPPDAVDEAIDLIETLALSEEKAVQPDTAPIDLTSAEALTPVAVIPEAAAEVPIELPVEALEVPGEDIVVLAEDALSLAAPAVLAEADLSVPVATVDPPVAAEADVEPALEAACPADAIAARPRSLTPLANARKSLISFLTGRHREHADRAEPPAAIAPSEPEAALVEAAIETISITPMTDASEDPAAFLATRQRLVELIAVRTRLPSEQAPPVAAETGAEEASAAASGEEEVAGGPVVGMSGEPATAIAEAASSVLEASAPIAAAETLAATSEAPSRNVGGETEALADAPSAVVAVADPVDTAPAQPKRSRKPREPRRRRAKTPPADNA